MSYRANSLYEEIDARNPGTIYSTNFENGIDHEENQLWFIVAPGGQSVKLTMISEHDHPTNIGRNDQTSVSIYNGDRPERANLITKWTQYKPNTSVTSQNNDLLVNLDSREPNYSNGNVIRFAATYEVHNNPTGCGQEFVSDHGTIKSPNYPNKYPKNSDCQWNIRLPEQHENRTTDHIVISFADFETEDTTLCSFDYVKIYENSRDPENEIAHLCGTKIPDDVHLSEGAEVWSQEFTSINTLKLP